MNNEKKNINGEASFLIAWIISLSLILLVVEKSKILLPK